MKFPKHQAKDSDMNFGIDPDRDGRYSANPECVIFVAGK